MKRDMVMTFDGDPLGFESLALNYFSAHSIQCCLTPDLDAIVYINYTYA